MAISRESDCTEIVKCSIVDGVALVKLNRPEVRNALNLQLRKALANSFQILGGNADVRCIVLTGDERAFCAGADLNEYVDATTVEIAQRNMSALWGAIKDCPKPIIAAVNGYALGGGCELAMHADLIIAGRSSVFGQPEVKIGLIPGGGATQRLTRAVGKFQAMKLLLTGVSIKADEALRLGLVSDVVDDGLVFNEAMKIAKALSELPAFAVQQIKQLVIQSMNVPLDSGLALESKAFQLIFSTADKKEGITAFLNKRTPKFSGF